MVHANSNSFVRSSGASPANTSLVIGAPNLAAIIAALIHTTLVSNEYNAHRFPTNSVGLLRALFAFSCLFGILGNVVHGLAVDVGSVPLAVLGRFLFGFSSAEILHRQLVGACVPSHVVAQSARLVHSRISGLLCGILLGVTMEVVPFTVRSIGIRWMQTSSWLMVTFWLVHFVRVLVHFREIDLRQANEIINGTIDASETHGDNLPDDYDYDSDSSDSHRVGSPSFLYSSGSGGALRSEDPFHKAYGGAEDPSGRLDLDELPEPESPVDEKRKGGPWRQIGTFASRTRKLLQYSTGIPISLFIVVYTNCALELYLSGTSVIGCRYFGWSGIKSGLFLFALGSTIMPLNFICEFIARRYEDRTILRVGVVEVFRFISVCLCWSHLCHVLSAISPCCLLWPFWHSQLCELIFASPTRTQAAL